MPPSELSIQSTDGARAESQSHPPLIPRRVATAPVPRQMRPDHGLAAVLTDAAWEHLKTKGCRKEHPYGHVLLRQGDRVPYVLVLLEGQVKVERVDADGNVLVLAMRGPGEVLGELGVLDQDACSATVTAADRCVTRVIGVEQFMELISSLELEQPLLRHTIKRFREEEHARARLALLPAGRRLACGLLHMAEGLPQMQSASAGGIEVRLDQRELGLAFGLSRSTVSTELTKLSELGVVQTRRGRVIVSDVERLCALSQETSEKAEATAPNVG